MCLILAQAIFVIGGVVAIIAGKVKLTAGLNLEGTRARIAGGILAASGALAFGLPFCMGMLAGGGGMDLDTASIIGTIAGIGFLVLGAVVAVAYAMMTRPAQTSSVPPSSPPPQQGG